MKKLGIIVFVFALVVGVMLANLTAFGKIGSDLLRVTIDVDGVSASGKTITEKRDVKDFTGIDVGGAFKVEATAGKDFSVEIDADENLMPYIKTEVRDGVLHVENHKHFSFGNTGPMIVRISAPTIEKVGLSGASSGTVSGLQNKKLDLDASGASKLTITGSADEFIADISGATKIDADGLTTQNSKINASGASSVSVNVASKLEADASGASKIVYSGTATVEKRTSGASKVSAK